jgi:hypothetical protein
MQSSQPGSVASANRVSPPQWHAAHASADIGEVAETPRGNAISSRRFTVEPVRLRVGWSLRRAGGHALLELLALDELDRPISR